MIYVNNEKNEYKRTLVNKWQQSPRNESQKKSHGIIFTVLYMSAYQSTSTVVVYINPSMNIFCPSFLGVQEFLGKFLPKIDVMTTTSPLPLLPDLAVAAHVAAAGLELPQTARLGDLMCHSRCWYGVRECRLLVPCNKGKYDNWNKIISPSIASQFCITQ